MAVFKPLKTITTWTVVLMVPALICLALCTLITGASLVLGTPINYEVEEPDPLSAIAALAALATYLTWAASGLCSLIWIYGAARNTKAIRPSLDISPGWAVGWFFVPIAALFKPYQYMARIWTTALGPKDGGRYPNDAAPVLTWWMLYIIGTIALNISSRLDAFGGGIVGVLSLAGYGASFVGTLLFMNLVRKIARMQAATDIRLADQF